MASNSKVKWVLEGEIDLSELAELIIDNFVDARSDAFISNLDNDNVEYWCDKCIQYAVEANQYKISIPKLPEVTEKCRAEIKKIKLNGAQAKIKKLLKEAKALNDQAEKIRRQISKPQKKGKE